MSESKKRVRFLLDVDAETLDMMEASRSKGTVLDLGPLSLSGWLSSVVFVRLVEQGFPLQNVVRFRKEGEPLGSSLPFHIRRDESGEIL